MPVSQHLLLSLTFILTLAEHLLSGKHCAPGRKVPYLQMRGDAGEQRGSGPCYKQWC